MGLRIKYLLAFRGFLDDPQRVLAAVCRLTFVGIEGGLDLRFSVNFRCAGSFELGIAAFADTDCRQGTLDDPQLAASHNRSLMHLIRGYPVQIKRHHYRSRP